MNIFTTVARICNDLQLKQVGDSSICEVNIAIPDRKKENGVWIESAIFATLKVWGKMAENLCQYKQKGEQIAVTARLCMDSWVDASTGNNRSKLYFTAISVDFIGAKSEGGGQQRQQSQHTTPSAPAQPQAPIDDEPPF